ncbi:hypothetical protein LVD15_02680 [Fulvivirga maritima]|uniref:hypothetical protein n=1 Tax=Fulvivirga maritima TaxID=2904247 RepID=UPI001F359F15|nr:hypothetical protein [Fulvivirga maritima]UII27353.1 hypothetical protein LVD15_02680 [Fulvivirga maritima]
MVNYKNWWFSIKIFYREFNIYNLIFTLFSVYLLYIDPVHSIKYIFWFKVVGYAAITIYFTSYKKERLYFFYNLGIKRKRLFIPAIIIDFVTLIIILMLANYFIYG